MRNCKTVFNWDEHNAVFELYMSLSRMLTEIDTADVVNLDILWTILENAFLPSNYITTFLFEFRARKFQVGEKMKDYHFEL